MVTWSKPLDIQLPFRGRIGDARASEIGLAYPLKRLHGHWDTLPYPVAELLVAQPGPFNLEVDVKHDDRVVGTWCVECNPHDPAGLLVSHVRAELYVCGSAAGNPRESGAFLAIDSWWVNADDPKQVEALYGCLSSAVIERLSSLLANNARERVGEPQSLVLYLLDVRRRDRRVLKLGVLEATLLLEIADGHCVAGVDLKVAHGRGIGSSPMGLGRALVQTVPMPFAYAPGAVDPRGVVFIREIVSPANAKWSRRASDRPMRPVRIPATGQELTDTA